MRRHNHPIKSRPDLRAFVNDAVGTDFLVPRIRKIPSFWLGRWSANLDSRDSDSIDGGVRAPAKAPGGVWPRRCPGFRIIDIPMLYLMEEALDRHDPHLEGVASYYNLDGDLNLAGILRDLGLVRHDICSIKPGGP